MQVDEAYTGAFTCNDITDVTTGAVITVCSSSSGDLFDNKGMYWMRLMATLESVVSYLVPDGEEASAASVGESLERIMDVLGDTFLNKTLTR